MRSKAPADGRGGRRFLLLTYLLLLAYGSIYPFDWSALQAPLFSFVHASLPRHFDKGDLVQNVLVYMPFGLLLVAGRRGRFLPSLVLATLAGTVFSFGMETTQQWLPGREASMIDVATNFLGTLVGGLMASLVRRDTLSGATLLGWRDAWVRPGQLANVGLATLGLWLLSQTSPLVPTLDVGHLRRALSQLYGQVTGHLPTSMPTLLVALCYVAGLGMLLRSLMRDGKPSLRPFMLLVAFVLCCKVMIDGRQLSLEMLLGAVAGVPLVALFHRAGPRLRAVAGVVLLVAGMTIYELTPGKIWVPKMGFNWVPFLGQMQNLSGFEDILEFLWPTMAMACLTRAALPLYRHDAAAACGAMAVGLGLFCLEWMQLTIPGRTADITQVVLAVIGWLVPWFVSQPAAAPRRALPRI